MTPPTSRRGRSSSSWTPCTPWPTRCTTCTASCAPVTPARAHGWPTSMAGSCWLTSAPSTSTVRAPAGGLQHQGSSKVSEVKPALASHPPELNFTLRLVQKANQRLCWSGDCRSKGLVCVIVADVLKVLFHQQQQVPPLFLVPGKSSCSPKAPEASSSIPFCATTSLPFFFKGYFSFIFFLFRSHIPKLLNVLF